jgi:hypothetical protein
MKAGVVAISFMAALLAGPAWSANDDACATASHLVHAEFPTPHIAAAKTRKQLKIVVVGTTSSMIAGASGASKAYPVRLQEDLNHRLSGIETKVVTYAKPRETAAEAEKALEGITGNEKPDLVIWQTGTFDAMRSVDIDEFRIALGDGIDTLQSANADVVLMNMQYSPRTDSMIAVGSYAETMRLVALQHEILLFDRFAVMKQWNELGTFDLYAATKKTDIAERVHGCIGRLLGDLIVQAAAMVTTAGKGGN